MVPSAIVVLPAWPVTANGKVDRHSLPVPGRSSKRKYRAPQTPQEESLCEIFAEVLKSKQVGADDDFFELGGHSLLAVRLLMQIERRTKKKLPLAAIFQHSSPAALAELFREPVISRAPVVEMKKGTSGLPLFFLPGAGGSASVLLDLARHLPPDDPFFVLQDPAFDESDAGKDSIEAMAAEYIECVQQKQPAGPYLLGGWSVGGLIAFEMARQLRAQNQTIPLLALVDSYPLAASVRSREEDDAELFKSFLITSGFLPHHMRQIRDRSLTLEQALAHALQIGTEANVLPPGMPADAMGRFFSIYRRHVMAGRGFKPSSIDLTMHVWRA